MIVVVRAECVIEQFSVGEVTASEPEVMSATCFRSVTSLLPVMYNRLLSHQRSCFLFRLITELLCVSEFHGFPLRRWSNLWPLFLKSRCQRFSRTTDLCPPSTSRRCPLRDAKVRSSRHHSPQEHHIFLMQARCSGQCQRICRPSSSSSDFPFRSCLQ